MQSQNGFGIVNYVIFGTVLAISALIGIISSWRRRKTTLEVDDQRCSTISTDRLLNGDSNEQTSTATDGSSQWSTIGPFIPIIVSYLAHSVGQSSYLLGNPSEIYQYGTQQLVAISLATPVAILISCYVFVPILYELKITSINEVNFTILPPKL